MMNKGDSGTPVCQRLLGNVCRKYQYQSRLQYRLQQGGDVSEKLTGQQKGLPTKGQPAFDSRDDGTMCALSLL